MLAALAICSHVRGKTLRLYRANSWLRSVKNLAMSSRVAFLSLMRMLPTFKFSSNSCNARELILTPANCLPFV